MHYLITGGAGFIGSHLAETLLHEGHAVTIIDDLSTGAIRNIEHLKGMTDFHYVIDSIFDRPLLAELIDDCDAVFHLAAAVGVKLIVESPVRTIATNIKGTEAVLEFASKKKRKVLLTSTSEVYGKASKLPFSEADDLVLGPTCKGRWSYACSKALDEFLALARLMKAMTHSRSEIRYIPYDEAYEEGFEDMPRRVPDIGKIRRLLNFEPTRSIGEIVQDVMASLRRELRHEEASV
jgi:nucleoside-diphosphate-sugar epimerase